MHSLWEHVCAASGVRRMEPTNDARQRGALLADTRTMTIHMRRGLCRDHAQSIRDAMTRPPAAALAYSSMMSNSGKYTLGAGVHLRVAGGSRPGSFWWQLGHFPIKLQTQIPHNSQARRGARAV